MSGTVAGGLKTAQKNLARNPNHYKEIGARGGKRGRTGGFASQKVGEDGLTGQERARLAGKRGGEISRRRKIIKEIK